MITDKGDIAQTLINLAQGIIAGTVNASEMHYSPASRDTRKLKTGNVWVLTIKGVEQPKIEQASAPEQIEFKEQLF